MSVRSDGLFSLARAHPKEYQGDRICSGLKTSTSLAPVPFSFLFHYFIPSETTGLYLHKPIAGPIQLFLQGGDNEGEQIKMAHPLTTREIRGIVRVTMKENKSKWLIRLTVGIIAFILIYSIVLIFYKTYFVGR